MMNKSEISLTCVAIVACVLRHGYSLSYQNPHLSSVYAFEYAIVEADGIEMQLACTFGEKFTAGTYVEVCDNGGGLFFVYQKISSAHKTLDVHISKEFDKFNMQHIVCNALALDIYDSIDRIQRTWDIKIWIM